jgi:hypothetical protein
LDDWSILERMPRFFFHIFNDEITIDEEGTELPDLDSAREKALDSARDLVCESVHRGYLNLEHRIEIADEQEKRVLTLTFREAFTIQG